MNGEVRLIENFVSWQGEGPDSGATMVILRFKTCNLNCPWCDTAVKMRISAEAPYQLSDIQETLYERCAGILVTGGEPTVSRHFDETVMLLNELDYPIANVETNGYNLVKLLHSSNLSKPIKFMYSPKLFTDGDVESALMLTRLIQKYRQVHIKVVYEDTPYVHKYLETLYDKFTDMCFEQRVWLMPEGTTREELISNSQAVFDACERYKLNFSSRSHIIFGFV